MKDSYCFKTSSRLRKPSEFYRVYQNNQKRVKGRYFIVLAFCRTEELIQESRVGFVVSKKVSKRAVIRNRVKRLMRESFRHAQVAPDYDYVIIAKIGADRSKNIELHKELSYLWRAIHKKCDIS